MRNVGRALLATLGVAIGVAAAEGGLRGALAVRGTPYSSEQARHYGADLVRSARLVFDAAAGDGSAGGDADSDGLDAGDLRLHPYLGFARQVVDDQLVAAFGKRRGRLVLFVGGSVAAGFANRADRLLGPAAPFAGQPFHVLQLATAGHKQPQQLHVLAHVLSLGLRPDLVINLDGFNEVALGADNAAAGLDPSQPSQGHWLSLATETGGSSEALAEGARLLELTDRVQTLYDAADRRGLFASALTGHLVLDRVRDLRGRILDRRAGFLELTGAAGVPAHLVGPLSERDDPIERSVAIWAASSRNLAALCAAHGSGYVHVLQPTLHDAGSKPLTDAERADGTLPETWRRGVVEGYPQLRAAAAALADEGLLVMDASRVFAAEAATLYHDGCHFGEAGNRVLADALLEFLVAATEDGRLALD